MEIGQELQENEKQIRTSIKKKNRTPSFAEDDFKLTTTNPKIQTPDVQKDQAQRQKSQNDQKNMVSEFK